VIDPDENMAGYRRSERAAHVLENSFYLQRALSATATHLTRLD
jgi:hypothetical protein